MKNYTPETTWKIIRKFLPYNCKSRKVEHAIYDSMKNWR